ncbi:hypothetical protein Kosp01_20680 [Kocuria sp. NBRC 114282]|nr:hypothetical protein Kosp01_20680 [Kocuria sp. NBRC 114282]
MTPHGITIAHSRTRVGNVSSAPRPTLTPQPLLHLAVDIRAAHRPLDDSRTRKRRAGAVVVLQSRHGQDSESEASADASSEAPSDGSAGPSTKVGAISSSIEV